MCGRLGDPDRRFAGTPALSVTGPTTAPEGGSTTAVLTPPAYTTEPTAIDDAEATTRYLEVVDRADNAVVTVVELLSPANKYAGPDRLQYLAKRRELLRSPAHFIELDLLRGGPRVLAGPLPPADYYALVYRAADRPRAGVWPWRVRDPIPLVPVPPARGRRGRHLEFESCLGRRVRRRRVRRRHLRRPTRAAADAGRSGVGQRLPAAAAVTGQMSRGRKSAVGAKVAAFSHRNRGLSPPARHSRNHTQPPVTGST